MNQSLKCCSKFLVTLVINIFFARYGRRKVVFASLAINIILRIVSVFIVDTNYYLLLVVTALGTTFSPMGIRLAVTLVAE